MRHFRLLSAALFIPLRLFAADHAIPARVATLTIDPREVPILN